MYGKIAMANVQNKKKDFNRIKEIVLYRQYTKKHRKLFLLVLL